MSWMGGKRACSREGEKLMKRQRQGRLVRSGRACQRERSAAEAAAMSREGK